MSRDPVYSTADAITRLASRFTTPARQDANLEDGNVTDALYYIGDGLKRIADAMEKKKEA